MRYDNTGVPFSGGLGASEASGAPTSGTSFNPMGMLGGAGIGGMIGSLFGGSPSGAANQYLNQLPGAISPYMQPYMQAGGQAIGNLGQQYGNILSNPGGALNQIGAGFHQSPGFQFALNQAMRGAGQAAAAGGMAGSPAAQQQAMQTATQLGNQDYYNWLNQATGLYGQGLQGEQGLAGLGMQGATNMSNLIANQLQNQAAMAYAGQAAQNQGMGDIGSMLGGALGGIL